METGTEQFTETDRQPAPNGSDFLYISMGEAARRWHKSKATISKDVSRGKLQWHDHEGSRRLFAPEIAKLYGPLPIETANGTETGTEQAKGTDGKPHANGSEPSDFRLLEAVLEAKDETIRTLRDQLASEREAREEATRQADRWHTAFNEIKALPAPPANIPAVVEQPQQHQRRGLFGLFRRAG